MVAFPFRMPTGFPGQVTRSDAALVEPNMFNASSMPAAYGHAVRSDANGVRALTSSDAQIDGFLVRPYPTSGNGTDGLGAATPVATTGPGSVMKRGYMTVKLGGSASAARNGAVYVRVGNVSTGKVVGDVEAAADITAAEAAVGGNTGNATMALDGTTPTLANVQPGVYAVKYTTATAFNVFDPKGDFLGSGVNGTAFADQIKFVNTAGGTAMVAGDTLNVTVTFNTIPLSETDRNLKTYFTGPADAGGIVEIAFNL